ncbi:MAG TPA: YiiX/YebB-like N1pC/P60 family cysteine hydrolase [Patescibacteria group bacterium]|nr:YiiX/YebB-like N1pC/P60 family cysteine hydrolase [Patescibacteria group bacterium]
MRLTPPALADIELRDGDIVLQTILGTQGFAIIYASSSLYTHMGFIKMTDHGPAVVEAVGPVKDTRLTDWVARGVGQRLTVMRVKDASATAIRSVHAAARKYYGLPYDFFFLPDHKAFYCSELVRQSFLDAGIPLGQVQKVGELGQSRAMDAVIEERWVHYPLCAGVKGMTLEKCRMIIMEQELITPASIARDPKLVLVYSNYPLD